MVTRNDAFAASVVAALMLSSMEGCVPLGAGGYPPSATVVSTSPESRSQGSGTSSVGVGPTRESSTAPTTEAPRPSGCSGPDAIVYDDDGFQGRAVLVPRGRHDVGELEALGSENDTIRSVCVPAGCVVTLFEHGGFEGETRVFRADTPGLAEFAGSASSVDVTCM